jgi:hypothetical protein
LHGMTMSGDFPAGCLTMPRHLENFFSWKHCSSPENWPDANAAA